MMADKDHNVKKEVAFLFVVAAFVLVLFKDILIGGRLLFGTDFVAFYLGMKQFLFNEIQNHGSIPLWNPYLFGGIPFWAHFESTIFYPLGFLFWLIPPARAYGYTMFIHLVLAGFFMFLLARSLGTGRAGSFAAALIFIGNGFIMAILFLGHLSPVQSYIWLPLIIYFLHRAVYSKRPSVDAGLAGFFWGLQILAGAPQDAYYTFLASLLFLAFTMKHRPPSRRPLKGAATSAFLLFVIGAGVAAIQIIPAFEFIGQSVRTGLDNYVMVTERSYPPEGIITTVMPRFFGNYAQGTFWVGNVPFSVPQRNMYGGILSLILLAFLSSRHSDNKRILFFLSTLAVIAVVLALGKHTPLYRLAYFIPGFDRFRAPSKILVLWVFALSLLAGKGMDNLLAGDRIAFRKRLSFLVGAVVILVLLDLWFHFDRSSILKAFSPFIPEAAIAGMMPAASKIISLEFHRLTLLALFVVFTILLFKGGRLRAGPTVFLLCAFLIADLVYVNHGALQHQDHIYEAVEQRKKDLHATLGKDPEPFRIGSFRSSLGPNIEMYCGYQTAGGFTALFPKRYYEYMDHYTEGSLPEGWVAFFYGRHGSGRLMDLMNVKYEIHYDAKRYMPRRSCLPRAFMVSQAKVLEKQEILDHLTRPDFDPTRTVLFEKGTDQGHFSPIAFPGENRPGRTRITSYRPDEILLEYESPAPAYLFMSEMYYPGWKAYVDGLPIDILQGNYLFRVVAVPEGKHAIRFVFDPWTIKLGTLVSLFTLFTLLIVFLYRVRCRLALFGPRPEKPNQAFPEG